MSSHSSSSSSSSSHAAGAPHADEVRFLPRSPDDIGREKLRAYRHVCFLGRGGFAEVAKYIDISTQAAGAGAGAGTTPARAVAIKSIHRSSYRLGTNLGAVKEVQAMAELSGSDNIVRLHDAFPFGDRIHLVLEYCATDLSNVLRDPNLGSAASASSSSTSTTSGPVLQSPSPALPPGTSLPPLPEAHVKGFLLQILRGIAYVHGCRFMHRDIKPDNLLVTEKGVVKLADFGHAAPFPAAGGVGFGGWEGSEPLDEDGGAAGSRQRDASLFYRVVTLWYRAPELLFGSRYHSPAVDMWSLGCVFAELLLRGPIFPAQPQRPEHEEREQLAQIFRIMGTPIDPDTDPQAAAAAFAAAGLEAEAESVAAAAAAAAAAATSSAASAAAASSTRPTPVHPQPLPCNLPVWPGCSSLPGHADFEARKPQPWASVFPPGWVSAGALDLLSQLLVFDPLRRLTAEQALRHPYFSAEPLPTPPERLPLPAAALAAAARR